MLEYEKIIKKRGIKMDKETKIELLKIVAMAVILILLIIGIVWMNKSEEENEVDTNEIFDVQETNSETTEEDTETTEEDTEATEENSETTENETISTENTETE